VPTYLKLINQYSNGLAKELMYLNLAPSLSPAKLEPYKKYFDKEIKDQYLKNEYTNTLLSREKPFVSVNILEKIKSQSKDSLLIIRLLSVLDKYKDRYVFIDFWGSWCGPCMSEMPHYPELLAQVKDLPVSFLFMAADTPQEKVDKMKSTFPNDAEFINLTSNELKILNNAFDFHSYPSHFLLSPGSNTANLKIGSIVSTAGLSEYAQKRIREAVGVK
jgi:thiol-disulfide isomerase/thioredoxin